MIKRIANTPYDFLQLSDFGNLNLMNLQPPQDIVLLIVNILDGVGDLIHFIEITKQIKKIAPKLKLVAFISCFEQDNIAAVSRVQDFIATYGAWFLRICVAVKPADASFLKEIQSLLGFIICISNLKDQKLKEWLNSQYVQQVPIFILQEYGCEVNLEKGRDHLFLYPMGIGSTKIGIRLIDAWLAKFPINSQLKTLASFKNQNFIKQLLRNNSWQEYLLTTRLLPGYTQSKITSTLFVFCQVARWRSANKPVNLDFYLPSKHIDAGQIKELLITHFGFKDQDIWLAINTQTHSKPFKKPSIRIFGNAAFPLDDQDYKSLYRLSNAATACSGDDTFSTSCSATSLPFFTIGEHGHLKNKLLRSLAVEAGSKHYQNLAMYFYFFYKFHKFNVANKVVAIRVSDLTCELEDKLQGLKPPHRNQVLHNLLLQMSNDFAALVTQQDCAVQREWLEFREHLFNAWNLNSALPLLLKQGIFIANAQNESSKRKIPATAGYSTKRLRGC